MVSQMYGHILYTWFHIISDEHFLCIKHGSLNVPIFHITQPLDSIRYMVYNGYYKVMSNIPKMGHLTTPVKYMVFPDDFQIPHRFFSSLGTQP